MKPTTKKPQCANPNGHAFNQPPSTATGKRGETQQTCTHCGVILTQHYNFARSPKSQPAELTISPKTPSTDKAWLEPTSKLTPSS